MTLPDDPRIAAPAAARTVRWRHSVPRLEGSASRRHRDVSTLRLAWQAARARRDAPPDAFVQFAGFPRSGHSLIGALLDAHPEAAISHELDAMGLYAKGLPLAWLPGLCVRYAEAFRADGQWWNGLSYEVPDAPPCKAAHVVGDKKGDWTTRWCARDEALWPRMRASAPFRLPMILVTRHPLDNIATLSLRKGGAYDRLRIEAPPGGFGDALKAAQAAGDVPARVSDAVIEDYASLCAATLRMKHQTPPEDWHDLTFERAQTAPEDALSELARFLRLPDTPDWRAPAARMVRPGGRSRGKIGWSKRQRARVAEIVRAYPFLAPYDADDAPR